MRLPLLLLFALPLHAVAQYGSSNYGSSMQQASMRQAQMSANFQRQQMDKMVSRTHSSSAQLAQWKVQREQQQAKQQAAEQKATYDLTRLAHRQDSLRRAHPAANAQQADAQQKEDAQQLALLTVRNYRDVFLPGQILAAEQARSLTSTGLQDWQAINKDLLDNAWWSKQDPTQLLEKITAYRTTLTALTTGLLGFDPATPPPLPGAPSVGPLDAMRAKGPFDPQVATQFLKEAARTEKVVSSKRLVRAINDFNRQFVEAAARPEIQQNPQKMRNDVKSGLNDINKEMERYELEMVSSGVLDEAQYTIHKYVAMYLPKNDKSAKKRAS